MPYRLMLLIAQSATFQSLTGAADEDDALNYIRSYSIEDLTDAATATALPRCFVDYPENWRSKRLDRTNNFVPEGSLAVSFEFEIPDAQSTPILQDEANWFSNQVGAIVSEMMANSGKGEPIAGLTHLFVKEFGVIEGPFRLAPEERLVADISDPANTPVEPAWAMTLEVLF